MNPLPIFAALTIGKAVQMSVEAGNVAPLLVAPIAIAVAAAYL